MKLQFSHLTNNSQKVVAYFALNVPCWSYCKLESHCLTGYRFQIAHGRKQFQINAKLQFLLSGKVKIYLRTSYLINSDTDAFSNWMSFNSVSTNL